jgi:hypothetical protein
VDHENVRSLQVRARHVGQVCSAADGLAQGIDEHTLLLTVPADGAADAARELAGLRGTAWRGRGHRRWPDDRAVREPRGNTTPC